jgi:LPS-assembly protein
LQAPDPSVERQSGFLPPNVGASSRLGFNMELPYYFAISNSQDATFFPKFTAEDGVLWQGEWRKRGKHGYHVLSGGVIDYDNSAQPDADIPGVRWHYFGRGHRDFGDNWRASYDFERVSDDTYLRNYKVERRGDLRQELDRSRTNQLRSNARLAWNKSGQRLTIDTYLFQGLRATDDASTTPYVLPLIDYRNRLDQKFAGGKTTLGLNVASLQRTGGLDTRRFTANAYWERDITTRGGHRFNLFAEARGDVYYFQDLNEGNEICSDPLAPCAANFPAITNEDPSYLETRFAPTAGIEWSYPLARDLGGARLFLEPRVQVVTSLANRNDGDIVNEDSQSIEFDYAGLFDYNKATGYDAFEDGQRINVGISASAALPNGLTIEGSVGQQFRMQMTTAFDASSGLGEKTSDIVGSLNLRYKSIVGIENRFRIDNEGGSIQRAETMAYVRRGRFLANASYVRLNEENAANNLTRREELTARGLVNIADHWSVGGAWRLDLIEDRTIRQDFLVRYEDECSTFGLIFRRDRTRDNNLSPDTAIVLEFTLKSLVN